MKRQTAPDLTDLLLQRAELPKQATSESFAAFPARPAVYLLLGPNDAPVLLATTHDLRRALIARLTAPEEVSKRRADLSEVTQAVRWRTVDCAFETRWYYFRAARVLHPDSYRRLVGFGPAWFLRLDPQQSPLEIRVSERVWVERGDFLGPWPTHKACQQALEGLWDLFELCRYPEEVRRFPQGRRCSYADMGRCDAPCDGSAPIDQYEARVRAAWNFARGGVDAWISAAEARMREAAAEQKYEQAALIKSQVDFARRWQRDWQTRVRPASGLDCLLILPAARRKAAKLLLFRAGRIDDGPVVSLRELQNAAPAWLADSIRSESATAEQLDAMVRMEQTWLLAHLLERQEAQRALIFPLTRDSTGPAQTAESLRGALERWLAKPPAEEVAASE